MSLLTKRELLGQVAVRYREAGHAQKTIILDEFVAATGYDWQYETRLLSKPVLMLGPIMNRFLMPNQSNGQMVFEYQCSARAKQANPVKLAGLSSSKVRTRPF